MRWVGVAVLVAAACGVEGQTPPPSISPTTAPNIPPTQSPTLRRIFRNASVWIPVQSGTGIPANPAEWNVAAVAYWMETFGEAYYKLYGDADRDKTIAFGDSWVANKVCAGGECTVLNVLPKDINQRRAQGLGSGGVTLNMFWTVYTSLSIDDYTKELASRIDKVGENGAVDSSRSTVACDGRGDCDATTTTSGDDDRSMGVLGIVFLVLGGVLFVGLVVGAVYAIKFRTPSIRRESQIKHLSSAYSEMEPTEAPRSTPPAGKLSLGGPTT
eukprot:Hpha_TRINITY_DN15162_c1_g3::TRINITY_DN15162_c1_g3_i1::g.128027::m.128027